jgi:nicotinamidase-related amidase
LTGVSANIAVNGTSIEAMNHGYRVIVAGDGIAGDPPEYVDALLRFTIRNVALVVPVQRILDHWDTLPAKA